MSAAWIVRLPNWLGDSMMALPTLRALARATPSPPVLWGSPVCADLLSGLGLDFEFIRYRRRPRLPGLSDAIGVVADVRRRRFDAALLLPNAFEAALLATLAGIPRRIGYATDGRGRLLSDPLAPPAGELHASDHYAGLLAAVGCAGPRPDDYALSAPARLRARAERLLGGDGDLIGLVPGSANAPAKRWPATFFAALATLAWQRWRARPVLLGSAADREVTETVAASTAVDTTDLAGCAIVDLAAALLRCRVVVSNDTGAAHLAAALGVPTAVLFGPTDPARTCPRGAHVAVVSADVNCQPCEAPDCPLDHRCMERLAPGVVMESVARLWQRV